MLGPKPTPKLILLGALLCLPLLASAQLTIGPITWDIIGLDSNNQLVGPNAFPVGVRVRNTSTTQTETNLSIEFFWDNTDGFTDIYLQDPSAVKTHASLSPGEKFDFYYGVEIVRQDTYFKKGATRARAYHIQVTSDQTLSPVSTPAGRQLRIEQLVSQNRNEVLSLSGPSEIFIGYEYTYHMSAKTATNGYEQLTAWPLFPGGAFEKVETVFTATAPTGFVSDVVYQDACGWDPDPASPTYFSCVGPVLPGTGGKVGGAVTVDVTVIPKSSGTFSIQSVIYDFSGTSLHYNSDFADPIDVPEIRTYDPATVGDLVWLDVDRNGSYDPNIDSGIPNVELRLVAPGPDGVFDTIDDVDTTSTMTNSTGLYQFTPLKPGDYRVKVTGGTVPPTYLLINNQPTSYTFPLAEGVEDLIRDFGYVDPPPLLVDLTFLSAVTPGEGEPVQIAWGTAAEFDNAGFNVYRATQPAQRRRTIAAATLIPGERLNTFMIPAQGSETQGAFYEFIDWDLYLPTEPFRAYFLEDIEFSGQATMHGPIPVQVGREFVRSTTPASVDDWMCY